MGSFSTLATIRAPRSCPGPRLGGPSAVGNDAEEVGGRAPHDTDETQPDGRPTCDPDEIAAQRRAGRSAVVRPLPWASEPPTLDEF
jgi:hypothetical protein